MKANLSMQNFKQSYLFNNIEVLTLSIQYPFIIVCNNPASQSLINKQMLMEVNQFHSYVSNTLYNEAIQFYYLAKENDFPFHPFEAVMDYTISYNENCFFSYYSDRYTYTGGAHGMTLRHSNTFELSSGRMVPLYCYFKKGTDYRQLLINEATKQASQQLKETPAIYFDDYPSLIANSFSENNYFLTPEGLSIYFQQYDIAPYSTGIVVFTIPYETIGWFPSC